MKTLAFALALFAVAAAEAATSEGVGWVDTATIFFTLGVVPLILAVFWASGVPYSRQPNDAPTARPAGNQLDPERGAERLEPTLPFKQDHILGEIVWKIPAGATHRSWTLRTDNHAHDHNIVNLSESPLYLELRWRPTENDEARPVGLFRLDLDGLLRDGYIRHEPSGSHSSDVRVRIVRDDDGSFHVQTNRDGPRFLLTTPIWV